MSKEKHLHKRHLQTALIVLFSVFCITVILFNAGEDLIETAYQFNNSITRGDSEFVWQVLTPSAKKVIDKNSVTSIESAVEMFERSELKPPAVDGISLFNAKLTSSDGVIYFHRGIGGWRVEYIGSAEIKYLNY